VKRAWLARRLLSWRHRHFVVGGNAFRHRRLKFFVQALVREEEKILDIGYGYGQFEGELQRIGIRNPIVALDIVARDTTPCPNVMAFVVADATHLPFADRSIEIVYSNSLLEHVGDRQAQKQAFKEMARVGHKVFVQTPNRHFPLEAHHLVPFFQYWPRFLQHWFARHILGHYEQVWLLDRKMVNELAAGGCRIEVWEEKVLGLTKSFVLHRRDSPPQKEAACRQVQ
jgi:SAM-dependent methyltransferase